MANIYQTHYLAKGIAKHIELYKDDEIGKNLPLVVFIAKSFAGTCKLDLNELINEGTIGLIKASKVFDKNKNVPFSSFASKYIKGYIQHAIYANVNYVHMPYGKLFKDDMPKVNNIGATDDYVDSYDNSLAKTKFLEKKLNIFDEIDKQIMRYRLGYDTLPNGKNSVKVISEVMDLQPSIITKKIKECTSILQKECKYVF